MAYSTSLPYSGLNPQYPIYGRLNLSNLTVMSDSNKLDTLHGYINNLITQYWAVYRMIDKYGDDQSLSRILHGIADEATAAGRIYTRLYEDMYIHDDEEDLVF